MEEVSSSQEEHKTQNVKNLVEIDILPEDYPLPHDDHIFQQGYVDANDLATVNMGGEVLF